MGLRHRAREAQEGEIRIRHRAVVLKQSGRQSSPSEHYPHLPVLTQSTTQWRQDAEEKCLQHTCRRRGPPLQRRLPLAWRGRRRPVYLDPAAQKTRIVLRRRRLSPCSCRAMRLGCDSRQPRPAQPRLLPQQAQHHPILGAHQPRQDIQRRLQDKEGEGGLEKRKRRATNEVLWHGRK